MLSKDEIGKIIKSFGLVFGDIGTSPIYTVTVVFLLLKPNITNIMGVLSLIFWTMTILVTAEYAWLAMSLGKRGEGGTIVLREILTPLLKKGRSVAFIAVLTFIGVSLLIGDGVITPAISILSAVEGMRLIPAFANISQSTLIVIAGIIAIGLFSFQRKGTEKVTGFFGPIVVVWLLSLAVSGLYSISHFPIVLASINPYYAIKFMLTHGIAGFFVLSEVILCATGGEALYADMGHLGRLPILRAWSIAFFALIFNYLGQGAFLALHPHTKNILFEMVYSQAQVLYIPFLILSIMATIIASQAMISGMFSIVYQGITTRIMPMFKVDYTSAELRTQIYIATVNWFLLIFVLFAMYIFKESSNLAAAYGLAVTGTMTITGIMMTWIFFIKKNIYKAGFAVFVTIIDILFLTSNMLKIPHGGYWSIIIASIPFLIILIYTNGQRRLYKVLKPINLDKFLERYIPAYKEASKAEGTALFFVRDPKTIPPYISNTMFCNKIIYQDNILVSINILDEPFGITGFFKETIAEGLRMFEIQIGYMEVIDIEKIINEAGIQENVIFYGLEDIFTEDTIWKIFAFIKKITPSFVQFYSLPSNKLHGIITRVEM
ncbi:MAG: potassium transporter Kup [Candidatus Melainabacteria bacterium RIFOXYA12_FULL_32_12]|nr:MAG: potassium transporter Kup [Candidatus Melainabacteria bacterium RIFOXYA12_FULL_32_12]